MAQRGFSSSTTQTVYTFKGLRFDATPKLAAAELALRRFGVLLDLPEFLQNIADLEVTIGKIEWLTSKERHDVQLVEWGRFRETLAIMKEAAAQRRVVTVALLWRLMSEGVAVWSTIASGKTKHSGHTMGNESTIKEREDHPRFIHAAAQNPRGIQGDMCKLLKQCTKFIMRSISPDQVLKGVDISVLAESTKQSDGASSNALIYQLTFYKGEFDADTELKHFKLKSRYSYSHERDARNNIDVPGQDFQRSARPLRHVTSVLNSTFRVESNFKRAVIHQIQTQLADVKLITESSESSDGLTIQDKVNRSCGCVDAAG
jgi:hypothetical protein